VEQHFAIGEYLRVTLEYSSTPLTQLGSTAVISQAKSHCWHISIFFSDELEQKFIDSAVGLMPGMPTLNNLEPASLRG